MWVMSEYKSFRRTYNITVSLYCEHVLFQHCRQFIVIFLIITIIILPTILD